MDGLLSCYHCERYCLNCGRYTQHAIGVYLEKVVAECGECGDKADTSRMPGSPIDTDNGLSLPSSALMTERNNGERLAYPLGDSFGGSAP